MIQLFIEITAFSSIAFSFFLVLLLVLKREKNLADIILIGWFIGVALHCIYVFLTMFGKLNSYPYLQSLGSTLPILHIPVIFLYTKELVEKNTIISVLIGLGPFIVYQVLFYIAISNQFLILNGFDVNISRNAPFWVSVLSPSQIIIVFLYIWFIRKLVLKQSYLLHQQYSFESKLTLDWINNWLITLFVAAIIIVISFLLADVGIYSYSISYLITFIFISLQILIVGIYGLKQTTFFVENLIKSKVGDDPKLKYEKSLLNDEQSQLIIQDLLEAMDKDQLYLHSELSITDIANHTGHSRVQISQILNQKLGDNFFDYVNKYRIEEVKQKLASSENDHLSILGIAMEAGFSSKSTFNKCFKKFTGTTPSLFKKNMQK